MKELELIIQAVSQLGEAGKEAFIWWLIVDKGLTFIGWMIAIVFIYKGVIMAINVANSDVTGVRIRDAMGIGTGPYVDSDEYKQMIKWIEERKNSDR